MFFIHEGQLSLDKAYNVVYFANNAIYMIIKRQWTAEDITIFFFSVGQDYEQDYKHLDLRYAVTEFIIYLLSFV